MARRNSAYGVHSMAKGLAQAPHWPRSRNGTSERTTPWGGGGRLRVCKPPPSLAREGRAADSPAGRFDGLRRTHPLCAVSSSSPGLRIQGPGLQNPRGHGLPCAAPGRTVGSSGGLTQSGGCSKRRSIPATVPAAPTPLARSAPPARCPGPISGTIYHVPLLRSPTTTPEPLPLLPLCPTALYHAMLWYTPSMRTRVPSFGQTFPNKVGPCQKDVSRPVCAFRVPGGMSPTLTCRSRSPCRCTRVLVCEQGAMRTVTAPKQLGSEGQAPKLGSGAETQWRTYGTFLPAGVATPGHR